MWMTFLVLVISTISTILNFFLLKIPTQTKEQDTKKILLTCTVLTTTGKKANNKDQNQKFSANATYPAIGKRSQGVLFFPKYYWIFLEFNFTTFMFLDMSGSNCDPQGERSTSTQHNSSFAYSSVAPIPLYQLNNAFWLKIHEPIQVKNHNP